MNMESFEDRESVIHKLIEGLAAKEEMNSENIFSDIMTFSEIYETDEDVGAYFVELAEKIGISFQEMLEFAKKFRDE